MVCTALTSTVVCSLPQALVDSVNGLVMLNNNGDACAEVLIEIQQVVLQPRICSLLVLRSLDLAS